MPRVSTEARSNKTNALRPSGAGRTAMNARDDDRAAENVPAKNFAAARDADLLACRNSALSRRLGPRPRGLNFWALSDKESRELKTVRLVVCKDSYQEYLLTQRLTTVSKAN